MFMLGTGLNPPDFGNLQELVLVVMAEDAVQEYPLIPIQYREILQEALSLSWEVNKIN